MVGTGILSNNIRSPSPECYTTFWRMTIYIDTLHWSGITPIFDSITDLDLITEFDLLPNCEVSIEHLQRVRHANRGRLLLRTPGPVPFGTCICSTCWDQRHPLPIRHYTSLWHYYRIKPFLLNRTFHKILVSLEHLQRVWHADRGRVLLRTPGPVPLWDLQVFYCWDPISPKLVLFPDFWVSNVLLFLLFKSRSNFKVKI